MALAELVCEPGKSDVAVDKAERPKERDHVIRLGGSQRRRVRVVQHELFVDTQH